MTQGDNTLVSIIIPVYNAARFLENTLKSIIKQTYENLEIIIIDDGSTDNSEEICRKFQDEDTRIIYNRVQNGGICKARNIGLNLASGEWICFCDHDDEYSLDFIETSKKLAFERNADIVCSAYNEIEIREGEIISEEVRIPPKLHNDWNRENIFKDYLSYQKCFTTVWNCMYKKASICGNAFDTRLKYGGEDVLFNLNALNKGCVVAKNERIVYSHYKRYGQSASSKFNSNRMDSLLICLNQENKMIRNERYNNYRSIIAMSEAYYLGGILKLVFGSGYACSYKKFIDLMAEIQAKKYYTWEKRFASIELPKKYAVMYLLFCENLYKLMWLLLILRGGEKQK